jgi:integrative and conjugative element protein (TIGR02256 family)
MDIFYSCWHNLQINIKQGIINEMEKECMRARDFETGGVLFGYYDGCKAIITTITTPGKNQELEPSNFNRLPLGPDIIDRKWEDGERYLGDWHSHPNNSPLPSETDDEQLTSFARDEKLNCPEPILIILGGNVKEGFELSVQVYKSNLKLVERLPFEQRETIFKTQTKLGI